MESSTSRVHKRALAERVSVVDLPFKSPFDWPALLRFFQSHAISGVEQVTDQVFSRVFRFGAVVGSFQVNLNAAASSLQLRIASADPAIGAEVLRRVRRMFDLDCDPILIAKHFRVNLLLAGLARRFPGLRVASGWDPFETAICSILGQLVSAGQRATLIRQLVEGYGDKIVDPITGKEACLFPDARRLARAKLDTVRTTVARRQAIRDFSRRVLSGVISLSAGQDPAAFRAALLKTKGLGPWSVEYISLRAMGDRDAFPKTDLILKRALALHSDLDLHSLSPWRAYAATYLWKEYAETLSRIRRNGKVITSADKQTENQPMSLFFKEIASPVGKLKLVANAEALVAVLWENERENRVRLGDMTSNSEHPVLAKAERQLAEYFSGQRTEFDLPLAPRGGEFQQRVWKALKKIPFGATRSYLDLARELGSPQSVRAVGAANGKNPLSIVIPCHRVIGANGALTGFAGGLDVKAKLLEFEAHRSAAMPIQERLF